jgi:thioredoxin-dependent peroxiredoxin
VNRFWIPNSLRTVLAFAAALFALALSSCGAQQRPDGGKGYLPVGVEIPNLSGSDQLGRSVQLRTALPAVIYFYPRAGTPGCTREACAFRDSWARYTAAGLNVIGVSSDSVSRQKSFAEKHELQFPLVSDPEHVWSKAFGVGSFIGMDARVSFLVDRNGRVVKVYGDVDPGVHAAEVVEDAKMLGLEKAPLDQGREQDSRQTAEAAPSK